MPTPVAPEQAERHTRAWLAQCVVGMNLCPFARPLTDAPGLRVAVCQASAEQDLRAAFLSELDRMQSCSEADIATTLLVFNRALADFNDYLDFLDDAQYLLERAGLDGVVQLASFHPDYQFQGEPAGAASHYSNRSPWPTLHLLREAMVTRLVDSYPNPEQIPRNNVDQLEAMGTTALAAKWDALFSSEQD